MAIVPLVKVTLYGPTEAKAPVLDELQRLGCAHLVALSSETGEDSVSAAGSEDARRALKYLRSSPIQRRPSRDAAAFQCAEVVSGAMALQRSHEALEDERDEVRRLVRDLEPWGDFVVPQPEELAGLNLWFYRLPRRRTEQLRDTDLVWQVVGGDGQMDNVVVVADREIDELAETPIDLDPRGLTVLRRRLAEIDEAIEEVTWKRAELTRWVRLLELNLDEADDEAAHRQAAAGALDSEPVFALQAWVGRDEIPAVEALTAKHGLALTVAPPDPTEVPPTKLSNPGALRGGEAAVSFYLTPEYRTWDPSAVLYFSFALFFAMIVSDAGYGLALAALLALFWKRLGTSDGGRRVRALGTASALAAVAYGVFLGSYFGLNPGPGTVLDRVRIPWLDPTDQTVMMSLSILIGAAHLVVANLVTAWRFGRSLRTLAPLGWCALIVAGLIAGFELQTNFDPEGRWIPFDIALFVGGFIAVGLFSSARTWSLRPKALALRLLDGLKALTGVSQAFGDVLSYLRLFALGLASSQLAVTFNGLARGAADFPGLGYLFAAAIIVLGHGLNFVLALMSGVVHGLRLNYIEFFNWSLNQEGSPFRPFVKKARS
jgi:V/A-type H+-transporting ATPase subunit I